MARVTSPPPGPPRTSAAGPEPRRSITCSRRPKGRSSARASRASSRGTSIPGAGAASAQETRVHCLGKCYIAPASAADAGPPRIEVVSREPIVLRRLVDGGAPTLATTSRSAGTARCHARSNGRQSRSSPRSNVPAFAAGAARGFRREEMAGGSRAAVRGEIRRRQRRRGRSRRLHRPVPHGRGSARDHRGDDHRGSRGRCGPRPHLRARRVPGGVPQAGGGDCRVAR